MAATIAYKLTGGASNSDPLLALGGTTSSVSVSGTAMNNIFANITSAEATSGTIKYRAIDIKNTGDATSTLNAYYLSVETASTSSTIDAGIEASPLNSTLSIANVTTAPAGVSFANYTSASKLTLPDIPAGEYCRLWLKQIITAGAGNISNDIGTLSIDYA